jgi:hypothetical protein
VGSGRGRVCDEADSCSGSILEGSGEVTMNGGGCGEEEKFS